MSGWKSRTNAEIVVAASNAPAKARASADYICDGVNDNVEINASVASGRRVVLTEGTFNIGSTDTRVNIGEGTTDFILEGQGQGTILKMQGAGYGIGIRATSDNITIKNLFIDCDDVGSWGIVAKGTHLKIENVEVSGFRGDGIIVRDAQYVTVEKCLLHDANQDVALGMSAGIEIMCGKDVLVSDCVSYNNQVGITVHRHDAETETNNVELRGNLCYSNSSYNYYVGNASGSAAETLTENVKLINNTGRDSGLQDVAIIYATDVEVINHYSKSAGQNAIEIEHSIGVRILGGKIISAVGEGIYSTLASSHVTVDGTVIELCHHGCSLVGSGSRIVNTTVKECTGVGIRIIDATIPATIQNCTVDHCGTSQVDWQDNYGILIMYSTAACNVYVLGNRVIKGTGTSIGYGVGCYGNGAVVQELARNYFSGMATNSIRAFTGGIIYKRYRAHVRTLLDCLAADTASLHALTQSDDATHSDIAAQPDIPRNLSYSVKNNTGDAASGVACTITFTGTDAKGESITDTVSYVLADLASVANGASVEKYTNKAFSSVTSIKSDIAQATNWQFSAGISDKLGLGNHLLTASDVYKVKKNNAAITVPTVSATYDTVNCATISAGDDFTIFYREDQNIIV